MVKDQNEQECEIMDGLKRRKASRRKREGYCLRACLMFLSAVCPCLGQDSAQERWTFVNLGGAAGGQRDGGSTGALEHLKSGLDQGSEVSRRGSDGKGTAATDAANKTVRQYWCREMQVLM